MNVQFSTTCGHEARKRLVHVGVSNDAQIDHIVEAVEAGKIRVGDPAMYRGTAPLYPTGECTADEGQNIVQKYESLA